MQTVAQWYGARIRPPHISDIEGLGGLLWSNVQAWNSSRSSSKRVLGNCGKIVPGGRRITHLRFVSPLRYLHPVRPDVVCWNINTTGIDHVDGTLNAFHSVHNIHFARSRANWKLTSTSHSSLTLLGPMKKKHQSCRHQWNRLIWDLRGTRSCDLC